MKIEGLRIAESYVLRWLERHKITVEDVVAGRPVWTAGDGKKIPITWEDVETLIAARDPVVWAWLNLVETKSVAIDGVAAVRAGEPWRLFPIQAKLARTHGDLLVECGAEVGKTRDIILRALWRADTHPHSTAMIGGDSDQTLIPIWEELEKQVEHNPSIGGGLVEGKCHIKPNRKKVFRNGSEIELRLAGYDGKNFRGGHFTDCIYADEVVKWKNRPQLNEFFRSGLPGSHARLYSTPDGDYSSPFFAMCARAVPINGPSSDAPKNLAPALDGERKFKKFHISKPDLPAPFWSPRRAAVLREQFGGEDSVGWITNVLGGWGSPEYSIFPMPLLKRCLVTLPDYRIVTATLDRQTGTMSFAAAMLADASSGHAEEMLARDPTRTLPSGRDLGREIASFFPDIRSWVSPKLYCGADLGFLQDPSEFLFVRVDGAKWRDLFRLHLRGAMYEEQAAVVAHLDHASGHRVIYSFDNGSAGNALINALVGEAHRTCPECGADVLFSERLIGRGFGQAIDEFDIVTGELLLNPDDRDASGNARPFRVSNKEFATRVLERKLSAVELEVAPDGGAGDQRLAAAQLLVNHTATGMNRRGERSFRAIDDHAVDARRQVALAIVSEDRAFGPVLADRAVVQGSGALRGPRIFGAGRAADIFGDGLGRLGRRFFE